MGDFFYTGVIEYVLQGILREVVEEVGTFFRGLCS